MKRAMILCCCLLLCACRGSAKVQAMNDLEQSKSAYKSCLTKNGGDDSKCQGQKRAYELDLETYSVISGQRWRLSTWRGR